MECNRRQSPDFLKKRKGKKEKKKKKDPTRREKGMGKEKGDALFQADVERGGQE